MPRRKNLLLPSAAKVLDSNPLNQNSSTEKKDTESTAEGVVKRRRAPPRKPAKVTEEEKFTVEGKPSITNSEENSASSAVPNEDSGTTQVPEEDSESSDPKMTEVETSKKGSEEGSEEKVDVPVTSEAKRKRTSRKRPASEVVATPEEYDWKSNLENGELERQSIAFIRVSD